MDTQSSEVALTICTFFAKKVSLGGLLLSWSLSHGHQLALLFPSKSNGRNHFGKIPQPSALVQGRPSTHNLSVRSL